MSNLEKKNIAEAKLQVNDNTQESRKQELVTTLNTEETEEKKGMTSQEYFKDLEITGRYPETIQKARENGSIYEILDAINKAGVETVHSNEKILGFLPKEMQFELWKLAQKHFGTLDFLVNYSGEGSQECSDGSDLLTIVKWNGKYYLAKLACGEFNRKTFTEGTRNSPEIKLYKSEIPLFVVNQMDSYFATHGTLQAHIRNIDVRLYLDLYAKLASLKTGEAEIRSSYIEEKAPFDWSQIKILEYEELKKILEK